MWINGKDIPSNDIVEMIESIIISYVEAYCGECESDIEVEETLTAAIKITEYLEEIAKPKNDFTNFLKVNKEEVNGGNTMWSLS